MLIQAINSKPHSFLLLMFLIFAMDHKIKGKLFLRAILFPQIFFTLILLYTLMICLIICFMILDLVLDWVNKVLLKLYCPGKLGDD